MKKKAKNAPQSQMVLRTKALNVLIKCLIIFILIGTVAGVGLVAYVSQNYVFNNSAPFNVRANIESVMLASNTTESELDDVTVEFCGLTITIPTYQKVAYTGSSHTVEMEGWNANRVHRTIKFFRDGEAIDYTEVIDAGKYDVKITFINIEDYTDTYTVDITLEIAPAVINHNAKFDLDKLHFVYDGTEKEATILNLDTIADEQYIIKYLNGSEEMEGKPVNAGEYTVQLIVGGGNYVLEDPIETTLVIEKATVSASDLGLSFDNKTVTYEYNKVQSNKAVGLAEDMTVTYKYFLSDGTEVTEDKLVAVGVYFIEATVVSDNYKDLTLKSTVTIEKQYLDISGLEFFVGEDKLSEADLYFDGTEKVVTIEGLDTLPEDVVIKTINNQKVIYAGRHMVEIIFVDNANYEFPAVYDFIVIKKGNITGLSVEDKEVNFDGKAHTIELKGELPEGTTLVPILQFTESGVHTITVRVIGGANYNDWVGEATLTIVHSKVLDVVVNSIQSATYNGEKHLPAISADESLSIKYFIGAKEIDGVVDADQYTITVEISDEHYSKRFEVNYTVNKASLSGVTISEAIYIYDAEEHKAVLDQVVSEDISVSIEYYVGNEKFDGVPKNVGTYIVVATLSGNNYEEYKIFSTITINKATFAASDIIVNKITHTYDGKEKNIEVKLVDTFTKEVIERENIVIEVSAPVINAGSYEQRYTITASNYEVYTDLVKLTINKAPYELGTDLYSETEFYYNGTAYTVTLNDETIEELKKYEAVVSYIDNVATACGTYEAKVVIESKNYETKELKVTWEIKKGILVNVEDYEKIFADTSVNYNGKLQYIQVDYTMLPEGTLSDPARNKDEIVYRYLLTTGEIFEIVYSGELGENVDKYAQKVTIRSNNYEEVVCEAELTIVPIAFNPADFGISFTDKEFVYDGKAQSIFVSGNEDLLFNVEYEGNGVVTVGEYKVVATLKNHNYLDCTMVAKIVVSPAEIVLDGVVFNNKIVNYNGLFHTIEATNVPNDLKVTYTYKDSTGKVYGKESVINAGTYTITVKFEKDNYITAERTATLTINKIALVLDSGVAVKDTTVVYDGEAHQLDIEGLDKLPKGVTYRVDKYYTDVGSHRQVIIFYSSNYNTEVELTGILTITEAEITGIVVNDLTVPYTGGMQTLLVEGTLPEGTQLVQLDHFCDPGEYEITVKIVGGKNYKDWTTTAKLTIEDSYVLYAQVNNQSTVYNGEKQLPVVDCHPSLKVEYYYQNNMIDGVVDADNYEITVRISDDHFAKDFAVIYLVNKAQITGVVANDLTVPYTGEEQTLVFDESTLPEGAFVESFTKHVIPGTYDVIVKIAGGKNYKDLTITAKLTIEDSYVLHAQANNQSTVYNGEKQLPIVDCHSSLKVEYLYNGEVCDGLINAGTYDIVVRISDEHCHHDYNLTYTINKAQITGVVANDLTVPYTGEEQTLIFDESTLPEGAFVESFTKHVAPGTYDVMVKIAGGQNYEDLTITAKLTIEDSHVLHTEVKNQTVIYNGEKQLPIVDCHSSLKVEYLYNGEVCDGLVNVGTYNMVVRISDEHYSQDFNVEFSVKKATMAVVIENTTANYNEQEHGIEISGTPEGAVIESGLEKHTEPGKYQITVTIKCENYEDYNQVVVFVINDTLVRTAEVREEQNDSFDFKKHLPMVENIDGENVTVKYYIDGVEVRHGVYMLGTYNFTIVVEDEHGYSRTFETVYSIRLYEMLLPISVVAAILVSLIISALIVWISHECDKVSQKHFIVASTAVNEVRGGILCESYAKSKNKKLGGRLYLTSLTIEFYANDYNDAESSFLINLADVRSVYAKGGNKIAIHANREVYEFVVPAGTANEWAKQIVKA